MKYKYKTIKNKDVLTVDLILPKVERRGEIYKVDTAKLLVDLKEKYDIISPIDKLTFKASTEKDVFGTVCFKIKYVEPRISRSKKKTEDDGE